MNMKRILRLVLFAMVVCVVFALAVWYIILNWHHRLGFGEYPAYFWLAISDLLWLWLIYIIERK